MEPATEPSWVNAGETTDAFECSAQLDCTEQCAADCEEEHFCGYVGDVDKYQEGNRRDWVETWTCPRCKTDYSEDCSIDDYDR